MYEHVTLALIWHMYVKGVFFELLSVWQHWFEQLMHLTPFYSLIVVHRLRQHSIEDDPLMKLPALLSSITRISHILVTKQAISYWAQRWVLCVLTDQIHVSRAREMRWIVTEDVSGISYKNLETSKVGAWKGGPLSWETHCNDFLGLWRHIIDRL